MSTKSAIVIKMNKEDIGKSFEFSEELLPEGVTLSDWSDLNEVGENLCKPILIKDKYVGILCFHDGDLIGSHLSKMFPTYEDARNLIVGGDCSYIWDGDLRHYANRKPKAFVGKWKNYVPIQGKKLQDVYSNINSEYLHVFEDGKWASYQYYGRRTTSEGERVAGIKKLL